MAHRGFRIRPIAASVAAALVLAACNGEGDDVDDPVDEQAQDEDIDPEQDGPDGPDADAGDDAQQDDDAGDDPAEADDPEDVNESPEPDVDPAEVGADELGMVPVLMYHQLLDDGGSEWDMSPDEFRDELTYLFDNDYRPVRTIDLVRHEFDIPAGTTPVVLAFDDSTRNQAYLDDDGEIHPDSSMGILIDVASEYDDVDPVASLYIISSSIFGGGADGPEIVDALHDAGMEIGNHTHTHPGLGTVDDQTVQDELATTVSVLTDINSDIEVSTLALPLGSMPENPELAASGTGEDGDYNHEAVLLVGSNPAPSPFSADFDPLALPRIQTHPDPEFLNGSAWWFEQLERGEAYQRYISDGDPDTISFPAEREDELADEFADRANPY